MRTPAEEAEFQQLGSTLGFFNTPQPVTSEKETGFFGFAGQTAANVLPGALEKLINTPEGILNLGVPTEFQNPLTKVPNFFDTRAPQGVGEHIVAGAGELAEYLPAILMTEGAGIAGLQAAGASARAAKIGGSALGFGLPMSPQGAETAALQGGVGALQTAAMDWGWKGKVAAGVIGGAAGYYEGAKQDQQTGFVYGALNLLGPTLIDPALNRILGANKAAAEMGQGQEAQAPKPHQAGGNIMDDAFQAMTPGQKQAHIEAVTGRSGPAEQSFIGPETARAGFFENAPASRQHNYSPAEVQRILGGREIGMPVDAFSELPGASIYGSGNQFDAFAGLQPKPIMTEADFAFGGTGPQSRVFDPRMQVPEQVAASASIYGDAPQMFDAFAGAEKAPLVGPQNIFSPRESALRAESLSSSETPSPVAAPKKASKPVSDKIPSGLQKLLGDDVGWTPEGTPLRDGFTKDAFALGRKLKTQKDVDRAIKMAAQYEQAANRALDTAATDADLMVAQEFANRKQYFTEAVEYATGNPPKAATFRSHDPDYTPNVPHPEWTKMIESGLDAPAPKMGDTLITWSDSGSPLDSTISKVEGGVVHYTEYDFMTGKDESKIASLQEFDLLQKHPKDRDVTKIKSESLKPPVQDKPPAAAKKKVKEPVAKPTPAADQVRVRGKFGMETARVVGREGNTLHVEIEDPIFGMRKASVLATEAMPMEASPAILKGGVPFKDVESIKLRGSEGARGAAQRGETEADLLGSIDDEAEAKRNWILERLSTAEKSPLVQSYKLHVERENVIRAQIKDQATRYHNWHTRNDKHDDLVHKAHDAAWEELVRQKGGQFLADDTAAKIADSPVADIAIKNINKAQDAFLDKPVSSWNKEQHEAVIAERNKLSREGEALIAERAKLEKELTNLQKEYSKFNSTEYPEEFHRDIEDFLSISRRLAKEDKLRGSVMEGAEPGRVRKTLSDREKTVLSVEEGLKRLPPEAATIIGEILARVQVAAGQGIDVSLARKMLGAKGGMYETSGKVALNLQWINGITQNWDKMSAEVRGKALMRVTALFGHEVSHISHKFGERTNLMIDGVPLTKAVMQKVDGLSLPQRQYIIEQVLKAKGEPSTGVSAYLAGDVDTVFSWYKRHRPNLTREQAQELAAGEFMAEIGSIELVKRMKVEGLPDMLRVAIDKFKQVLVRVIDWFREQNNHGEVAALQSLSDIANKMHDHFAAADTAALHSAFPASQKWVLPPTANPYSSVHTAPLIEPSITQTPYVKTELARLGLRAAVGATIGGVAGPTLTDHQMSFAESAIAGGVLGMFGPAAVKMIVSKKATQELIDAAKAAKGGPTSVLRALFHGKSLRELGAEARYGWRGDGSFAAKVVRTLESDLNVNSDPKIKAIWEQARGIMGYQMAMIEDALKKSRWTKVSEGVKNATGQYIEGKISIEQYRALLTDDAARLYGELMIAARTGTSAGTDNLAAGMRKSAFRDTIIKNRESYVGRFYKAYRDGEFDMAYFDKVKQDFMDLNSGLDIHNADALLREHMVETKANRNLFSSKRGTGAQAIDSQLKFRRRATEEEIYMQQLEVASLEHDQYSQSYKAAKEKLDWMESHKITDNWRGWLGEIKDPTERMLYTFQKIYPSSIAGKIFDLLDNGLDSFGNKFAYSSKELTQTRALLESVIAEGGPDVASLQTRLKELDAFTPLPEGAAYGKLSGKFTNRFVRDQISTYDTPYKWMDQPVMRAIASINSVVKINRTVLNPATALRNYLQMPLFMLMARVSPQEIFHAAKVIHKGADPELLRLLRERHILGVDYAAQELTTNLGSLVSGYLDSDIAVKVARSTYDKLLEAYQQPDMLLRAGAFISAQKRIAKRMGLELNDPAVIDAAVEATDRVTMNYATVPRVVKAARQLPFVSLFISYTSEITKIIKNLSVDAMGKGTHIEDRMHAITALTAMAAIPSMLVAAFESNLSKEDRADWHKLRALQPDYARSRFMLPLEREKDGRFRFIDMTSMIPADNYTQMIKASLAGDMESAVAANPIFSLQDTPLLNIATEQISGEDLRTGRPVSGAVGRVKEIMKEILPPAIPPGFEGQRLLRAFSQNAEGSLGLTNLKTGVQTRPSDIISSYLTGMRFANVQLSAVQRQAVSEAQQQISEEKLYLNDTIRMNVPEATRVEAMNRYRQSVEQIVLHLNERMGVSPASLQRK